MDLRVLVLILAVGTALFACGKQQEAKQSCDRLRATVQGYGEKIEGSPSASHPGMKQMAGMARHCAGVMHQACVEGKLDQRCYDAAMSSPSGWTECLVGMQDKGGTLPHTCVLRTY